MRDPRLPHDHGQTMELLRELEHMHSVNELQTAADR